MQKFRLDWNYHSNAIEGNSLNYGETVAFLMHGITAKGKPFKDYLDIRGHNNAIDYLLDLIRGNDYLTETDIRNLHQLLLGEPYETTAQTSEGQPTRKRIIPGQYKTSPNHVLTATGQIHYYATPEETPAKMGDLMNWYREASTNTDLHPVVVSALFHHRFVSIHPFDDGNGRITRLLMNLMLMRHHFPPTVIKQQDRGVYYLTLSQADAGDDEPFVQFVAESVKAALDLYLKGAKGESLDEPDDLDKELALFKMEVKQKEIETKTISENHQQAYLNSFKPFIDQTRLVLNKFKDLFSNYDETLAIRSEQNFLRPIGSKAGTSHFDAIFSQAFEKDTYSYYILSFHLLNFRQNPSASISLDLVFSKLEFSYQVIYEIQSTEKTRSVEKKYNDFLSKDELAGLTTQLGKDLLFAIKQKVWQ